MKINGPGLWLDKLPIAGAESHKYTRGSVLVIGGALASTGAARLSAIAALRAGAGLATVASPSDALQVYASALTTVMVRSADSASELDAIIREKKINAVLVGPGSGVNERTRSMVLHLLATRLPLVLDADALSVFASTPESLFAAITHPTVMTPHEGEFARIFNVSGSREERALAAAKRSGAVVVLKGHETLIAAQDGQIAINQNAPATLATAGSGDVLAGLIISFIAQGMLAFDAACAGVYVHSQAAKHFGPGLIADDLATSIPPVMKLLYERAGK